MTTDEWNQAFVAELAFRAELDVDDDSWQRPDGYCVGNYLVNLNWQGDRVTISSQDAGVPGQAVNSGVMVPQEYPLDSDPAAAATEVWICVQPE